MLPTHGINKIAQREIIILGAGQVGTTVATTLSNRVTTSPWWIGIQTCCAIRRTASISRTVQGQASHPGVLRRAGCRRCRHDHRGDQQRRDQHGRLPDRLDAVPHTDQDRACARPVPGAPALFSRGALPIDVLISPEQLVTDYILRLIEHAARCQVPTLPAARPPGGGACLLWRAAGGTRVAYAGRAPARRRGTGRGDLPLGTGDPARWQYGDRAGRRGVLRCVDNIPAVYGRTAQGGKPFRRLIFAGSGGIGRRLASSLENDYRVKIIRHNGAQTRRSEDLHHTIVLQGDAADGTSAGKEHQDTDVFCAVTRRRRRISCPRCFGQAPGRCLR